MLSHHELAALLLLRDTARPVETLDGDFLALRRYRLVEVDDDEDGAAALRLTERGEALLERLGESRNAS